MHVNDIFFYFLKIIFDISTSKRSKHVLAKKKKIFGNAVHAVLVVIIIRNFFFNVGVHVSLRVPRLISRVLKLTTMQASSGL
jgi:hypothetical protein